MRIVVTISDQVWGGKHRYMADVLDGLRAVGHRVCPIVESGGMMAAELERSGFDTTLVAAFADGPAAAAVSDRLRQEDAHVICVTGRHDGSAADVALTMTPRTPMVVAFRHSAFPIRVDERAHRLFHNADVLIATSFDQAEQQFGTAENVVVVPSAVDRRFLDEVAGITCDSTRAAMGLRRDVFAFTVLARLSWEKGIDRTLRAFARTKVSGEAVLLIAGDGPARCQLTQLTSELGLTDQVRFLGHVASVAPLLAVTDVVLLTSTVPETGPLALKEAMGAGIPVIASRVGGIPELVQDGETGLLVSTEDEIAAAMDTMYADPERTAEMGTAARAAIEGGHLLEQRMPYLCEILDRRAIHVLPMEDVLAELSWDKIRCRAEQDTGFVFVPRTSEIAELPGEVYRPVTTAMANGDPTGLLALPVDERRRTVALLYRMGALVRRASVTVG